MGLKVSKALDKKYSKACELCSEKHRAIYGVDAAKGCAFKDIDGEYCADIASAERMTETKGCHYV